MRDASSVTVTAAGTENGESGTAYLKRKRNTNLGTMLHWSPNQPLTNADKLTIHEFHWFGMTINL